MGIKSLYSRSDNVYPTKTTSVAKALETTMIQQTIEPLRIEVLLWSAAKAAFDIFKRNPVIRYGLPPVYASVLVPGATEKTPGSIPKKVALIICPDE